MSTVGANRPPDGGTRRRPRGGRSADQMALNGSLVRTDNSDDLYKRVLAALVERELSRPLTYPMAIEALAEMADHSRRAELLREASVRWSISMLARVSVMVEAAGYAACAPAVRRTLAQVGHRLEVVEGKRRRGRSPE